MSKMNVFDRGWTDIVFEGRNKNYGAYKLRRESNKTTLQALGAGIMFLGIAVGAPVLLSSFGTNEIAKAPDAPTGTLFITDIEPPLPKEPEPVAAKAEGAQKSTVQQVKFKPLNVVSAAQPTPTAPTREQLTQGNPSDHTEGPSEGNAIAIGGNGTSAGTLPNGTGSTPAPSTSGTAIIGSNELDAQPEYPGGMDKFRQFVGSNFNGSNASTRVSVIKLYVSFVIEKDGTMTNIKARGADEALSREAARVLQSMRTKWKPGKKGGETVRTAFSLPITVNMRDL